MVCKMEIVDDAIVADAPAPSDRLSFQAHNVTAEGVYLHVFQGLANSSLIAAREFSEFFLRRSGEKKTPHW
jgi:hypothetical protein